MEWNDHKRPLKVAYSLHVLSSYEDSGILSLFTYNFRQGGDIEWRYVPSAVWAPKRAH